MKEEFVFMDSNQVWELVKLPLRKKPVGRKWVSKIKRNTKETVKQYKARTSSKVLHTMEGH